MSTAFRSGDLDARIMSASVTRRALLHRGGALALTVTAAGIPLSACGGGSEETGSDRKEFGFSHPYGEAAVVENIRHQVSKYADTIGWSVKLDNTTGGDIAQQTNVLQTWITNRVPGMCVLTAQPDAFVELFKQAAAQDLVVTTYAFLVPGTCGGALFPPDQSGTVVADATVAWIKGNNPNAKVAALTNTPAPVAKERVSIAIEKIKTQTQAKIVSEQDAFDQTTGRKVIASVLQAHPDLSVVVGFNDDAAVGAAEAFEAADKDPEGKFIIGQDGTVDALTLIKKDRFMKATAAIDQQALARGIVDLTVGQIEKARQTEGRCKVKNVVIPAELVTAQDPEKIDALIAGYQK